MFYSAERAASEIGVQANTIREWDKEGKLSGVRRKSPSENHLFHLSDLKDFMKTNPPTEVSETVVDCPFCKKDTCKACQGEKKVWIKGSVCGHPLTKESQAKDDNKFMSNFFAIILLTLAPFLYVFIPMVAAGMTNAVNEAYAESEGWEQPVEKADPNQYQDAATTIALGIAGAGVVFLGLSFLKSLASKKDEEDTTKFIWEFHTMGSTKQTATAGWQVAGRYEIPVSCKDPVDYIRMQNV